MWELVPYGSQSISLLKLIIFQNIKWKSGKPLSTGGENGAPHWYYHEQDITPLWQTHKQHTDQDGYTKKPTATVKMLQEHQANAGYNF